MPRMAGPSQNAKIPGRLYVSNAVSAKGNTVEVYESGTYKHIGEITKGITNFEGLWVDKAGEPLCCELRRRKCNGIRPRRDNSNLYVFKEARGPNR